MIKRTLMPVLFFICMPGAASAADTYEIDSNHTYPSLEFPHFGISVWRGKFNSTSGSLSLDREAGAGHVKVEVDAASIDFGHDEMNTFALGPDWLHADEFPAMTYAGDLKFNGDVPAVVDGELTLRGVTRPMKLTINHFGCMEHPILEREVCGADAQGVVDRTEFGMTEYPEGGMIDVKIQVEAIKMPESED